MAIDTGSLYYLVDPFVQFESVNGKPIVGGHVEVFEAGTDNKVITYADWDGTRHPFKIPLGSDGRAVILVDPGYRYDAYVYDSFNNLVCSRLNIIPLSDGDITIDGMGQVYHDETLSGKGTPNSPLTVISGGKVYGGIYPIDVNNEIDMISADNVPLGVQEPLYFVKDDDEGLVIGISSTPVPEGTMNESAFGYQDGQITSYNGSAFSAGNSYEAGSYVDIDGNTINVTGLQPAGDYQSAGDYVVHDELSSYATQDWVENQSYMKEYMESAFYPSTSNPSGYLTAHQDISNKLDATAFSTVSGDFLTAVPSEYVTENTLQSGLSSKLDSTAFSTVSSTFLTAHQSLDGLMSASLLEQSGGLITGYNGTAFAGQGGGGVTGDYELSAGSGISIVDYPLEQKTVISVTAQGGNPEVEQAVIDNSANWNEVSAKLDTTAFSNVSGTFLTAHQDLSDYQTIAGMTAYQSAGDYATTAQLADKVDSSAIGIKTGPVDTVTGISGTYISAWTANNASYASRASLAYADNQGNYFSSTYIKNTDLSTEDGKVTAISGIPLSAGGDVPEGVMSESGLGFNAVNEISGYNGSAIAQYGAEKQWLVHDDTLVHAANSAQYALGCNISALQRLMGIDETVLWSGETLVTTSKNIINLSESMYNFNSIKIYDRSFSNNQTNAYATTITEVSMLPSAQEIGTSDTWVDFYQMTNSGSHYFGRNYYSGNTDGTKLVTLGSYIKSVNSTAAYSYRGVGKIFKIVGVHRISG